MDIKQRVEIISSDLDALKAEVEQGGGGGDLSAYLTKEEASTTYETQTGAAATYETQSHASSTYVAKNANPLVIATYTNPTEDTNDGTGNIYLGSLVNSTADSQYNTVIGYNADVKPKTLYSVAIGRNCAIEYAKGNSNGANSVAINGKVYGKESIAIQGYAGVDTDTYGENRIAILGNAANRGEYLVSLNSRISGNSSKNWCTAINAGKQIGGGTRFVSDCDNSVYIGQLRASISNCSGCVGIGSKYFNKNDQTYNNVVAIGNELLPSTSNCVILGSFSNDMRSSGSFFAVGNGTDDSNRSNLVEITTPFKVSTAGIEVNGASYGSVSYNTYSSTTAIPTDATNIACDVPYSHIVKQNDFTLLKTFGSYTYAVRFTYSQSTTSNTFFYKGSVVNPGSNTLETYVVEIGPDNDLENTLVRLIGKYEVNQAT